MLYIILLLLAWIAALFSGIAFVYGIQLRERARGILGRIISIRTPFVFSLMVSKRYFTMFAGEESSCEADIFFRKAWYEQAMPANRRICCENSR